MSSENLNNLSQEELNKTLKEEYKKNNNLKRERTIEMIKKVQKQKHTKQKIKTFDEYFQECIKNKTIPKDTPLYLKKALERAMKEYDKGIKVEKSYLKNFAEMYVIDGKPGLTSIQFFEEKDSQLKDFLRNHRNIKVKMIFICKMEQKITEKIKTETKIIFDQVKAYFYSETHTNFENTDVKDILPQMLKEIIEKLDNFQNNGSGWYFKKVIRLEIHILDDKQMKGDSYIPLPEFIMRKKGIINMENKGKKCFLWSIFRYLHPRKKHSSRINDLRKYENDLNFKGIDFPIKAKDIQKFEKQNPGLPGVNVFSVNDNNNIYPLRLNEKDCRKTIDLFLFSKDEKQHYSLIKNFSRLTRSQITSDRRKIHICKKCLSHFTKKDLFEKHLLYCEQNETVAIKMPVKNTILNFKNYFKKLPIPFVIYADFECFPKPINSCQPNPNKSYTQSYQKHELSGCCLYLKGLDGMKDKYKPIVYTKKTEDEDISDKFIKHVRLLTHMIYQRYYMNPKPIKLTSQEQKEFQSAKVCHI